MVLKNGGQDGPRFRPYPLAEQRLAKSAPARSLTPPTRRNGLKWGRFGHRLVTTFGKPPLPPLSASPPAGPGKVLPGR